MANITRVDLRIPNEIFKQIEDLAKATNQPKHHRTNKIITTPVILNLISLGLKATTKEGFNLEDVATKETLKESELEKKILASIEDKLDSQYLKNDDETLTKLVEIITNRLTGQNH